MSPSLPDVLLVAIDTALTEASAGAAGATMRVSEHVDALLDLRLVITETTLLASLDDELRSPSRRGHGFPAWSRAAHEDVPDRIG
jgi:hypothetical protein